MKRQGSISPGWLTSAVLAAALAASAGCTSTALEKSTRRTVRDWGPLAAQYYDAGGQWRTRGLGPIYERVAADGSAPAQMLAVRPFYAFDVGPQTGMVRHEYLWPVGTTRRLGDEFAWRVLCAWGKDDNVNDSHSAWDLRIFPLYFQGREADGRPYFAIFPLGGRIPRIALRDEVGFALFPLYVYARVNQTETHAWLWPIVAQTTGPGDRRFRVFPFYGYANRDRLFEKQFILWPFYTDASYVYPDPNGFAYIVFPLWGHGRIADQEFWTVLPPFFRFTRSDRGWGYYGPWPFVRRTENNKVRDFHLWPLYGHADYQDIDETYVLFPFLWRVRRDVADQLETRYRLVPFIDYSILRPGARVPPMRLALSPGGPAKTAPEVARPADNPARLQDFRLWPLFTYRSPTASARQFRTLDLWPLRARESVERNWAPWWTLAEYRVEGEASDTELLWGVFRRWRRGDEAFHWSVFPVFEWSTDRRDAAGRREWSVLKGLVGYDRAGPGRGIRMLYVIRF